MTISATVSARVRQQSGDRCGYCLIEARYVYAPMEIDHIIPKSKGGTDDEDNLWQTCPRCNLFKGMQTDAVDPDTKERVTLYNPRRQRWAEHFAWDEDGVTIVGLTPCGRATVVALKLNYDHSVELRRLLVQLGWHPPQ